MFAPLVPILACVLGEILTGGLSEIFALGLSEILAFGLSEILALGLSEIFAAFQAIAASEILSVAAGAAEATRATDMSNPATARKSLA
jgi:hypothetical protein